MGLQIRLLLLVLIAVLPAVVVQIYTEIHLRRDRGAEIHERALHYAGATAAGMQDILEGSRQLLVAISRLPMLQFLGPDRCNDVLRAMLAELPAYTTIAATDRDGRLICSGSGVPTHPISVRGTIYFRDALLTNGFAVGHVGIGPITGRKSFPVAQPIHRSGETIGVLVAGLDLNWLRDQFSHREMARGAVLMIVDRSGTVMAGLPDDHDQWAGRKVPDAHREYILGDQSQTTELADLDGTRRVFAYIPVNHPPAGFAVAIGLDKEQALATIEVAMFRGLALILAAMGAGLVAAALVGHYFVRRPVAALLDATRRWRDGDYTARAGLRDRSSEIGRLGDAFDEMAERLQRQFRQKDLLLREVNHRVMNSLQLLSSMLALQRRRITDTEARTQFEQARRRIQSLAMVHRRLHRRDTTEAVEFHRFLRELCADITRTLGSQERPLEVAVDTEPVEIGADKVIPLALIVYELLTNAYKHARPRGGVCSLRVNEVRDPEGTLIISVSDNGPGLPADFEQGAGLGIKLVRTLLSQLRGSFEAASSSGGTTISVRVPMASAGGGPTA